MNIWICIYSYLIWDDMTWQNIIGCTAFGGLCLKQMLIGKNFKFLSLIYAKDVNSLHMPHLSQRKLQPFRNMKWRLLLFKMCPNLLIDETPTPMWFQKQKGRLENYLTKRINVLETKRWEICIKLWNNGKSHISYARG